MGYSREDLQTVTKVRFQTKSRKSVLLKMFGNAAYSNISSLSQDWSYRRVQTTTTIKRRRGSREPRTKHWHKDNIKIMVMQKSSAKKVVERKEQGLWHVLFSKAIGAWEEMVIRDGVHREGQENRNPEDAAAWSQKGTVLAKGRQGAFQAITSPSGAPKPSLITIRKLKS